MAMAVKQIILVGIAVTGLATSASGQEQSEAPVIEKLPITGMMKVTDETGEVRYLSEDRRFVFVGTMYDLWKGEALSAGVSVSTEVDWRRNGVSIEKISFVVGGERAQRTLLIAPECRDCKDLLRGILRSLDRPINILMLASSEKGKERNGWVWCARDREAALVDVYLRERRPEGEDLEKECDRFGLMLAEQAAMLFGIGQLPMYVDEEGNGHTGKAAIYKSIQRDN